MQLRVGETEWSSGDKTIKEWCLFFGWKDAAFPKAERDQWRGYPGMIVMQYFRGYRKQRDQINISFRTRLKLGVGLSDSTVFFSFSPKCTMHFKQ